MRAQRFKPGGNYSKWQGKDSKLSDDVVKWQELYSKSGHNVSKSGHNVSKSQLRDAKSRDNDSKSGGNYSKW
jgi:hypothetical protein